MPFHAARVASAGLLFALLVVPACNGGRSPDAAEGSKLAAGEPAAAAVDPALAAAVDRGRELFFGDAACVACHKVGDAGSMVVGPNLGVGDDMQEPVAVRAKSLQPHMDPIDYVVQSIVDPDAVVVEGYAAAVMKPLDTLPQGKAIDDAALVDLTLFVAASGDAASLESGALKRAQDAVAAKRKG